MLPARVSFPHEGRVRHAARRSRRRTALALTALASLAASPGVLAAQRPRTGHARLPAGDCQPYATTPCLLPFPDNRLTRSDYSTSTGVRVQLPVAAMPVNRSGQRID